jgi:glycosyltransferase involved in cell wall biosynthesis
MLPAPPRAGLTVVVPCLNEGPNVHRAYTEITTALKEFDSLEILLVDDGSTDDTLARIKALASADRRVRYLSLTRNFGLEAAQAAGFAYASQPWIAQLECDLQNPPSEIPKLLDVAAEGYEVVFGIRAGRRDPRWRRWGSRCQQLIARRVLGIDIPPGASTFRVLRSGVAKTLAGLRLGHPYTIAMIPMVGARYACVPTEHRPRSDGRSRWRLSRLVGHSFELFIGYSWRPLAFSYLVGAVGLPVAVVLAALAVAGLATPNAVSIAALLMAATTLATVALVGRYLHRLMMDQRPSRPYYIREANLPVRQEDLLDAAPGSSA